MRLTKWYSEARTKTSLQNGSWGEAYKMMSRSYDKERLQIDSSNPYLNMMMPPMNEAQRDVPSAVEKHTKWVNRMIPDIPTAACSPFFSCTISVSCTGYSTNPAAAHAITTPKFVNHPIAQQNQTKPNLKSPTNFSEVLPTHLPKPQPKFLSNFTKHCAPNVCVTTKMAMANSAQGLKDKSDPLRIFSWNSQPNLFHSLLLLTRTNLTQICYPRNGDGQSW